MQYLLPYASYKMPTPAFVAPEIAYNESKRCVRIGEHYIFLDDEKVLHRSDSGVNELFGFDVLDKLIPDTPSEWVHLGVDGTAAILSAVPTPMTVGLAKAIDIIHTISYFIEAKFKPDEAKNLYISGIITGIFSAFPEIGEALAAMVKGIFKATKWVIGGFFKLFFRIPGISHVSGFVIKMLSKLPSLKIALGKMVQNLTSGRIGSLLAKLPIIKTIVNFAKRDLDVAIEKAGTHLTRDLFAYSKAVVAVTEPEMKLAYKNLDATVKAAIDEKSFIEISNAMLHRKITGVGSIQSAEKLTGTALVNARESMRVFFAAGNGRATAKTLLNANTATMSTALERVAAENTEFIAKAIVEPGIKRGVLAREFNRLANKEVTKQLQNGVELTAVQLSRADIMRQAMKSAGGTLAKDMGKAVGKRAVISGVKNAVNNVSAPDLKNPLGGGDGQQGGTSSGSSGSDSVGTDTTTQTIPAPPPTTGDKPVESGTATPADPAAPVTPVTPAFDKDKYFLRVAQVENLAELGETHLVFHAPKKDDTEGKLMLEGGMYDAVNLSEKIKPYENDESLLADIRRIKNNDDKTTVRPGEKKKWERSVDLSTPDVKADQSRYAFYFMIRDRSTISFAKKNLDETIRWSDIFTTKNAEAGFVKIGQSLYVFFKKGAL